MNSFTDLPAVAARIDASKRGLRAAGHRGVRKIAQFVVPQSLVVWRGADARGARGKKRVALTFDDGPMDLTPRYLDVLGRFGAKATFFVVGEQCKKHPDLALEIASRGHQVANHGYTHKRFPSLSGPELRDELARTESLLPSTGHGPGFVRPPHGAISLSSLVTCAQAGLKVVLWSFDSGDSRTEKASDVIAAFDRTESSEPGSIVLLHEGQTWTLDALPAILAKLKGAGHELVTVGELLHD
jgi:peptidoglycan/xylan/chitin deacetylase (PgdA/CDA1 family)